MSEADYMDDCHHADRYDDENRPMPTHEVIAHCGRVAFVGSRASCWSYKRQHGGFVQQYIEEGRADG